jgi:hypothetical protein
MVGNKDRILRVPAVSEGTNPNHGRQHRHNFTAARSRAGLAIAGAVSNHGARPRRKIQRRETMTRILLSRPWSDEDIATLRKLWGEGVAVRKLALRFRRSQSAIRGKAVQLGLKRPIPASRPPAEDEIRVQ